MHHNFRSFPALNFICRYIVSYHVDLFFNSDEEVISISVTVPASFIILIVIVISIILRRRRRRQEENSHEDIEMTSPSHLFANILQPTISSPAILESIESPIARRTRLQLSASRRSLN